MLLGRERHSYVNVQHKGVTFNIHKKKEKKKGKSHFLALALNLTLTVTQSPNHLATRHSWWRWCTALPLMHQPPLQYNITQCKGRELRDVKMVYSIERYMKDNPKYAHQNTAGRACAPVNVPQLGYATGRRSYVHVGEYAYP